MFFHKKQLLYIIIDDNQKINNEESEKNKKKEDKICPLLYVLYEIKKFLIITESMRLYDRKSILRRRSYMFR